MNKAIKGIIIIIAIIVVIVLGIFVYKYIQKNELSKLEIYNYEEDSNYKKYTDMEGIEFSYPSDYVQTGTSDKPVFVDPEFLRTSVSLVSEEAQHMSLENYVKASLDIVKQSLTVKGDISEKYINLNGLKAAKLDYVTVQDNLDLKLTQVIINKSGKTYILSIEYLSENAEQMQDKIDKMVKSFK